MKIVGWCVGKTLGVAALSIACFGCSGDRGETGASGAEGEAGPSGVDGTDGKDGVNGANGKDGINGVNGTDGKDGVNGTDGVNGADGKDGAQGPAGPAGGAGPKGEPGDPATADGRGPAFVLVDAKGKTADAWVAWGPFTYGETLATERAVLLFVGQQYAGELRLDLASGRPEPCYEDHSSFGPSWNSAESYFHSPDCSGPAYGGCYPTVPDRIKVQGVLYEAKSANPVGPWGQGTAEPLSARGQDGTCRNVSTTQSIQQVCPYAPVAPAIADAFKNPPYTLRVAY